MGQPTRCLILARSVHRRRNYGNTQFISSPYHTGKMNDITRIDQNEYVTVQGQYGVINEGTGYAIVNIQTKQMIARNISSFLDCVKTLEYIVGKGDQSQNPISSPDQSQTQCKTPGFGVRADVQHLIETHAPTTLKVKKEVSWNRSKYKCYDASGHYLGQVKGYLGDRYWEN